LSFVLRIWASMLGIWIHIGERFLPPTIHPMMVHFPIACLYVALGFDVLGRLVPSRDRFFDRVSFWLLAIALPVSIAAAAAGVISEQYVQWTPVTSAILSAHQRDAVITGMLLILALVARYTARYPLSTGGRQGQAWSIAGTGRGRSTTLSLILLLATVVMISVTATLGGAMVYQYGVGVHGLTFHQPLS